MILADEPSQPIYSLGKADRFAVTGDIVTVPKNTPGPTYDIPEVTNYKFETSHKWRIGNAKRPPLNNKEKFAYYNHVYKKEDDLGALPKKWNKVQGGAIGLEPRVKYDFRQKTPGPGRYDPSLRFTRPKTPQYFIGEKTQDSSIKLMTGTNQNVGPGKYRVESAKYTSKHRKFPIYSIGNGKRKPLYGRPWTKNETYWIYSSMGNQVQSKKKTEEQVKIGKSTREREKLRGTFNSMMERRPMSVRIPMPKF